MDLPPAQAKVIAASGYIYLFPLVANYRVLYDEAIDPSSPVFSGGVGHWVHHRQASSFESDVSALHRTSLDSSTWLDQRDGPWTITLPEAGAGRSTRVADLWGHVVHESQGETGDPRPLLIADDRWIGEVPHGVGPILRAETRFVRCAVRVEMADPGDLEVVRRIQRGYAADALDGGSDRDADAAPPELGWWPVSDHTLTTIDFWSAATFALSLVNPNEEDRGILGRLAEIGVVEGGRFDVGALQPDVRDAIDEGMDDSLTELMRAAADRSRFVPHSRADYDRDYFDRALAAVGAGSVLDAVTSSSSDRTTS
jgi:hypothetical protein